MPTAFRFLFSAILTRATDSPAAGPVTGMCASRNGDFGVQRPITGVCSLGVPAPRARDRVGIGIDWKPEGRRLCVSRYRPVVVDRHRLIPRDVRCIIGIRRAKGEILTHRGARRGKSTSESLFETSG